MALIVTLSNGGDPMTYIHSDDDEAAARMICSAFYQGYKIVSVESSGITPDFIGADSSDSDPSTN